MRTQHGSQVEVIAKEPMNAQGHLEPFVFCRREDGNSRWFHLGGLFPQNQKDLDLLADHSALRDATPAELAAA
jgi:hypothetical protein